MFQIHARTKVIVKHMDSPSNAAVPLALREIIAQVNSFSVLFRAHFLTSSCVQQHREENDISIITTVNIDKLCSCDFAMQQK